MVLEKIFKELSYTLQHKTPPYYHGHGSSFEYEFPLPKDALWQNLLKLA